MWGVPGEGTAVLGGFEGICVAELWRGEVESESGWALAQWMSRRAGVGV